MSSHHSLSPRESANDQTCFDIRHGHSRNSEIIEDKPPSPLSLQQDGVFSSVQSPPFGNDQLDSPSTENLFLNSLTNTKNQTLTSLSEINSLIIDQKHKIPSISDVQDHYMKNTLEKANSVSGDISISNCPSVLQSFQKPIYSPHDNILQQPTTDSITTPKTGSSNPVFASKTKEANLSLIASRKSIKELYGQPSWWGDGDNDYSYPHTSSFRNQETLQSVVASRKYSMQTDIHSTLNDYSNRPPAEAFIIDFSSSKPRLEKPASLSGSLSQCIPAKLRQGLDERERKKKEKQLEVKQQQQQQHQQQQSTHGSTMNKNAVTTTTTTTSVVSTTKSRTTTIQTRTSMNGMQKTNSRGGSFSAKTSTVRTSAATATATAATTTPKTTSNNTTTPSRRSSSITPNKKPQVNATKLLDKRITSKPDSLLRTGRIDSRTNLTSNSTTNVSRTNLTTDHYCSRGRLSLNQTSTKESIQSNRTNVRPPFSVGGRRISAGAASLTSQRTAPSQLNPSKVSSTTRGSMQLPTDSRATNLRGALSATRQTISAQRRGGSITTNNRGFMTPTTSSDAKQVKTKQSSNHSISNDNTRRSYQSPLGNSIKKPITSTFSRYYKTNTRQDHTTPLPMNRNLSNHPPIDNKSPLSSSFLSASPSPSASPSRISDQTASLLATIQSYDDPKAYLFYRMFQGVEQLKTATMTTTTTINTTNTNMTTTTTTTDSIFQAFGLPSSSSSMLSLDCQKHYSSEFSKINEQRQHRQLAQPYPDQFLCDTFEMDEQLANLQANNMLANTFMEQPQQQQVPQQPPSVSPSTQITLNRQNKYTKVHLSADEESHYQELPSYRSNITTISPSNHKTLSTKSPAYSNNDEIQLNQTQTIEQSSTKSSHHKIPCTTTTTLEANDPTIDATMKSMNLSMFVSTSITSLAPSQTGTYVIEGGHDGTDNDNDDDDDVDDGNDEIHHKNTKHQQILQHSDKPNMNLSKDNDFSSTTPRASPVITDVAMTTTEEDKLFNQQQQSVKHMSTTYQQTKQSTQYTKAQSTDETGCLPLSITMKLPDNSSSSSSSSSSNNLFTTSSYSNHHHHYHNINDNNKKVMTNEFDLNNQSIEHFIVAPHHFNSENNHHDMNNYYDIKRRNSENSTISKYLFHPNNTTNHNDMMIPPLTMANQLLSLNISESIGNDCHITISQRCQNNEPSLLLVNNYVNCTKLNTTTATTTTSSSILFHNSNKMNQLLTRLQSMPTAYNTRSGQSRNLIRTHSYNRGKTRYYSHGSASVPDPASPVRSSWSCKSTGTGEHHSLTNRMVYKTIHRQSSNDQTDSGFIETSHLMKSINTDQLLSPNSSSSTYFETKKSDSTTINLSQYCNEDMNYKKSNEVDSRTFTRRKVSYSNDQNDPQKYLTILDAESYQNWVTRMSELAQGINSLAREPLFQSNENFSNEIHPKHLEPINNNHNHDNNKFYPTIKLTKNLLPMHNDPSQSLPPILPDSTTDTNLSDMIECSAFSSSIPSALPPYYRSLETTTTTTTATTATSSTNHPIMPSTMMLNLNNVKNEQFIDFILSPESSLHQLNANIDSVNSYNPNESAIYSSLMVDTIRYLSIKLRQFSDKLAYQLSHNQKQTSATGNNTTEFSSHYLPSSTQQSQDNVQSSTKYALHDTFENMKAINQQLQVVGKLLFSNNEFNQIDCATSCEYLHKLGKFNEELHRFIPIEPAHVHHTTDTNTTNKPVPRFIDVQPQQQQQLHPIDNKSAQISTYHTINITPTSSSSTSHTLSSTMSTTATTTTTTTVTTNNDLLSKTSLNDNKSNKINEHLFDDEYY
ncbi:unnamed protein product [Schistosoma turkestanicum]|nr:unnamed protein product [Schistosoma turkestanicum]